MAAALASEAVLASVQDLRKLQLVALTRAKVYWRQVNPAFISESWLEMLPTVSELIAVAQVRAATFGASYNAHELANQGWYDAPTAFVKPAAFGKSAADGRSLSGLLYSPATDAKSYIGGGMSATDALTAASKQLGMLTLTSLADSFRGAASVDMVSRPAVTGYVRQLRGGSNCPRCIVLAGRHYKWNAGFLRHPRCDCAHIPARENTAGDLTTDPYRAFNAMSKAEQDQGWGKASAQAIRDGADMSRVSNAKRGIQKGGLTTSEGTGRRGFARGTKRATPDSIYRQYGNDRAEVLRQLEQHGYIVPGGQNPLGAIVGQREGFGQLGRGGTRVGASYDVTRAAQTGIRNPDIRATMTDAERRLADATGQWREVLAGRNPTGRGPLTPEISARVERDYRRWLATHGEIYTA